MSQLLMFALLAAGVIVIPMGFQFLAILGGKALLLAKMALLMTSIQGLKKIATSNLNYGLYSYGQGPCKTGSLNSECDEDDVVVSVDFEDLSHSRQIRQIISIKYSLLHFHTKYSDCNFKSILPIFKTYSSHIKVVLKLYT